MSKFPGFYNLPIEERIKKVKEFAGLTNDDLELLRSWSLEGLSTQENVIGPYVKQLKIAPNFLINEKDYFVPMVIEEPSVVAAASNGARMARYGGGFKAYAVTEPRMISQIQITKIKDIEKAKEGIIKNKEYLLDVTNRKYREGHKHCKATDIEVRDFDTSMGKMIVTHLIADVENSMGANAVNEMAEIAAPYLEQLTKGKVYLRIVSNFADKSLFRAETKIPKKFLEKDKWSGEDVAEGILYADALACVDIYSAVTRNKGILNGVCAVAEATGNDYRALEAGAHAYACRTSNYQPLIRWFDEGDNLVGKLEMPITVGTVGGTVSSPKAKLSLKILGIESSEELGEVMTSVGLSNNLAALRDMVTKGIREGHMKIQRETFRG